MAQGKLRSNKGSLGSKKKTAKKGGGAASKKSKKQNGKLSKGQKSFQTKSQNKKQYATNETNVSKHINKKNEKDIAGKALNAGGKFFLSDLKENGEKSLAKIQREQKKKELKSRMESIKVALKNAR